MTVGSASLRDDVKEIHMLKLAEVEPAEGTGKPLLGANMELIQNLRVRLCASVGHCELTVKDLFALRENTVLALDKDTRDPVDLSLDGKIVARGVLVAVDDCFGIKITEILVA
jgi:flagellar motor switch protein FliN